MNFLFHLSHCSQFVKNIQLGGPTTALMGLLLYLPAPHLSAQPDTQSVWQQIECIPADPPLEMLYNVVTPIEDFENSANKISVGSSDQNAAVTLSRDTTEHHQGAAALRVDYMFNGNTNLEYIQIIGHAPLVKPGLAFGFWYKNSGPRFPLKLRIIDSSGECHQLDVVSTASTNWQFVACHLDSSSSAWGGDGNKKKDYPCKLDSICIDRPQIGFKGNGSLWIDDLAILAPTNFVSPALTVETKNPHFGNLYITGQNVVLQARANIGQIRWELADFLGRKLDNGNGDSTNTLISFSLKQPGWFSCKIDLLTDNRILSTKTFFCAALPSNAKRANSDFFGVCTHFGQGSYPLESMDLLRNYGITQFRDEISWGDYESEKGHLEMPSRGKNFLQHAANLKMRPLIIFDYANVHYENGSFPNSQETIDAFVRYAAALAQQTSNTVSMFEIWNEWIGGCGMEKRPGTHDAAAYGKLLKAVYPVVKKARPDAAIAGIGGEYGSECASNIATSIHVAGVNTMDAWSIHPYRYPNSPEHSDLVGEITKIRTAVASTGEKSKAWVTEIGYPTHTGNNGCDEAAQARYLVRTLALMQSTRTVEKVFWYDFKDDGLERSYNENNFGLIHHQHFNCAPKPGIVAASAFVRLTEGAAFDSLSNINGIYVARYHRSNGSDTLLLWTTEKELPFHIKGKPSNAFDLMGTPIADHFVKAGENPIYLVGRNLEIQAQ